MRQKLFGTMLLLTALCAVADEVPDSVELGIDSGVPIRLHRETHDDVAIRIDGHLDEATWAGIEPVGSLRVIEPDTLATVPYASDLRLFYTERGIYVSFDLEQPADTIIERFTPRDAFDVSRDNVGFTLDTSGDGRYGYWMNLSLGDSEMDGTILPERQYGRDWDGAWYGATQRTLRGWSAEFYIPWSQMAMPKQDGVRRIGLYVSRNVAHRNERWAWPGLPSTQTRFISRFQPLELEEVDPRQQWSLFPYVSGAMDRVIDEDIYKAGMDVFWRPSTNFQLSATVNPDFGSVESDDVVVNLTANETFFPEKRLFFQEGQEIFNLIEGNDGPGQRTITVVNTRRIGGRPRDLELPDDVELSAREEVRHADIVAAAKVTGQFGAIRYGMLAAVEDETMYTADDNLGYLQEGRDFGAFRVLYEDSIGAAYRGFGWITTVVTHPEAEAIVHGGDFHYLSTSGTWKLDGQLLYSDRDEDGAGYGGTADLLYTQAQGMKHLFSTSILDDTIDVNDLGFQVRNDITDFRYEFEWIKSGLDKVRNFRISPFVRYEVNGEGYRTNNAIATRGSVTLNNLVKIGGFYGYFPQRFEDRNSFGNGTFEIQGRSFSNLNFSTDESKPFSVEGEVGYNGEYVYGRTLKARMGMTWRPRHNLSMEFEVEHEDREGWTLHQEDRDFTAFTAKQWRPELNVEYFPTARQQLRLSMQWVGIRAEEDRFYTLPLSDTRLVEGEKPAGDSDDFSISQLNFQLRYRWQIAPLSDLFIVYTKGDRRRTDLLGFRELFQDSWDNPLADQLVIKVRYRLGS